MDYLITAIRATFSYSVRNTRRSIPDRSWRRPSRCGPDRLACPSYAAQELRYVGPGLGAFNIDHLDFNPVFEVRLGDNLGELGERLESRAAPDGHLEEDAPSVHPDHPLVGVRDVTDPCNELILYLAAYNGPELRMNRADDARQNAIGRLQHDLMEMI